MAILDRLSGLHPALALRRAVRLNAGGKPAEAFHLMAIAARAGIPEVEYRVARCYLEGLGVPPSGSEGARWLRRAADHGSADAQALLAALCVAGLAGHENSDGGHNSETLFKSEFARDPDFETALQFAREAAQAGSPTGQAILGYILSRGPKAMRDLDARTTGMRNPRQPVVRKDALALPFPFPDWERRSTKPELPQRYGAPRMPACRPRFISLQSSSSTEWAYRWIWRRLRGCISLQRKRA
ncbi:hypothetical protein ABID26_003855 [Mesorhizobium shonense]|uniref:Sel1 repeat family protein n=1 Tax=Mesorhizobium shonense TaxID=1209948 RepID=A0ABV2HUZ4_9HYPH|nr:tetratricopeptide repeat protein [Mesorhizobium sp.]TIS46173.1 MAG: sel1 repeat family protein [Mesorhizobium sp.]